MKANALPRIRCTEELRQQLEKLAAADNRTLSQYITIVLENHVKSKDQA